MVKVKVEKLEKENTHLRGVLEQLQDDISRHGKYGGNIPRDTSFEISVQIDEALKGESE